VLLSTRAYLLTSPFPHLLLLYLECQRESLTPSNLLHLDLRMSEIIGFAHLPPQRIDRRQSIIVRSMLWQIVGQSRKVVETAPLQHAFIVKGLLRRNGNCSRILTVMKRSFDVRVDLHLLHRLLHLQLLVRYLRDATGGSNLRRPRQGRGRQRELPIGFHFVLLHQAHPHPHPYPDPHLSLFSLSHPRLEVLCAVRSARSLLLRFSNPHPRV
jgi:hypothetical protein